MSLRGTARATGTFVVLELSWLGALETWRLRWPAMFLVAMLVGWPLAVFAWRSVLPAGWRTTLALAAGLLAADVLLDLLWHLPAGHHIAAPVLEAPRLLFLSAGVIAAERIPRGRVRHSAALAIRIVTLVPVLLLIGLMVLVGVRGTRDAGGPADAALVLGYALDPAGHPQPSMIARVDRAVALYKNRRVPVLVVSGGAPVAGQREAWAMRDLLVARGVPDSAVILEDRARSTDENFACGLPILARRGAHRVLVVTEPWHMPRALLEAGRHLPDGITLAPVPASSPAWRDPRSASHRLWSESIAYLVDRVRFLYQPARACPPAPAKARPLSHG